MTKKTPFNLSDNEVQQWKSFNVGSDVYHLDHLNSCKHLFDHPERNESYLLYFTFSHHVFTRSIKDGEKLDPAQIYPYQRDKRVFDPIRFELSKHLPKIIETLPEQFCYHGGYSRYCSCKISQGDGSVIYYQVVYRVWRARGKMRFHVESAYPLNGALGKVKKVNFWVICHNLLLDKKLPRPAI
ncbi:MAG: hypothetical protein ABJN96_13540 [Marinomonas sp.]